ncbi:Oxidative stress [Heracleum sosnowskyi]|uniref:Oxidative stress n=1 Tax=Heracleum sosnowskyi TaxID=360622 RepID=A0AAD8MTI5_9APIA|nr:Oxidative stress [Heracleum sosnowskyi]
MGFGSLDVRVEKEEEHGVMMDDEGFNKFDLSASDDDDDDEVSSVGSVDSDDDSHHNSSSELDSSLSSSPNSPFSYSNNSSPSVASAAAGAALNDMSSLLQQLPIKRGLSKHFQGKSQSFSCLSNVRCLEDLAKPENPYNKRLKSCKSYVGLYGGGCQKSSSNQHLNKIPRSASSRQISKKTSRPSYSSLLATANRNTSSIIPPSYS